jgi:hypothetical protein
MTPRPACQAGISEVSRLGYSLFTDGSSEWVGLANQSVQ